MGGPAGPPISNPQIMNASEIYLKYGLIVICLNGNYINFQTYREKRGFKLIVKEYCQRAIIGKFSNLTPKELYEGLTISMANNFNLNLNSITNLNTSNP